MSAFWTRMANLAASLMEWVIANNPPPPPEVSIFVPIGPVSEQPITVEKRMFSLTLTDSQQCVLGPVAGLDKKGQPAPLPGPVAWASSDATILTVAPSDDGLSATVVAVGPLGNAQVTVTSGSDTEVGNVTVIAGAAVSISVPVGTPTDQPDAPPTPPPAPGP
jgi:hypothetical protein